MNASPALRAALASVWLGFAPTGSALADEPAELAARLVKALGARPAPCGRSTLPEEGRAAICGAYAAGFSALKSDLESALRRFEFEGARVDAAWKLRDGVYRTRIGLADSAVDLEFDPREREIELIFDEIEATANVSRPRGDPSSVESGEQTVYDGPFFSGIAGATAPVLDPSSAVAPGFPEAARAEGVEGAVILEAYALRDGSVGRIRVMSCNRPGFGFESAAVDALGRWRFDPGRREDRPTDVFFTIVFEFRPGEARSHPRAPRLPDGK